MPNAEVNQPIITTAGNHLMICDPASFFSKVANLAHKGMRTKTTYIDVKGKTPEELAANSAYQIIGKYLTRQSQETLSEVGFQKRLDRAYDRVEAGTYGRCSCGKSLSAITLIYHDALLEHCSACMTKLNGDRSAQFRQLMENMLDTVTSELEKFKRQNEQLALEEGNSRKSGDEADRSTEDGPRRIMERLISNREKQIVAINGALLRIEDGSYGFCDSCEEEIAIGRLKAIPFARTCVQCKEASVH